MVCCLCFGFGCLVDLGFEWRLPLGLVFYWFGLPGLAVVLWVLVWICFVWFELCGFRCVLFGIVGLACGFGCYAV